MYISLNELNNVIVTNGIKPITIKEWYPQINPGDTRIPISDKNEIHYSMSKLCARNDAFIKSGNIKLVVGPLGMSMDFDNYKRTLDELLSYLNARFPNVSITADDAKSMYTIWKNTTSKYAVSGILNITNKPMDLTIDTLANIWVPEISSGYAIPDYQVMSALHKFVPELTDSIVINDYIVNYMNTYLCNPAATAFLSVGHYDIDAMSNFVSQLLPNVKKETLDSILEKPVDPSVLPEYYMTMMRSGYDYNMAKALLSYHRLVIKDTEIKVRESVGLRMAVDPTINITLPSSIFRDVFDVNNSDVISFI